MAFHRTPLLRRIAATSKPNPRVFPLPVPPTRAVVVGSSGALGSSIVRHLQAAHPSLQILGIDVQEDSTVPVTQFWNVGSATGSLRDLTQSFVQGVEQFASTGDDTPEVTTPHNKLDILVCAAGGWAGDPTPSDTYDHEAILDHAARYADTIDAMRRINLEPALATAYLLQHRYLHFPSHPLCVFLGATAALQPTPGMLGYGLSKVATHHVAQTVAAGTSAMVPKSLKKQPNPSLVDDDRLTILTVLPSVLDTPGNAAVSGNKTPVDDIAQQIATWTTQPALRPHSGALLKAFTKEPTQQETKNDAASSTSTATLFQIVR